jgi:hypothetical protein
MRKFVFLVLMGVINLLDVTLCSLVDGYKQLGLPEARKAVCETARRADKLLQIYEKKDEIVRLKQRGQQQHYLISEFVASHYILCLEF